MPFCVYVVTRACTDTPNTPAWRAYVRKMRVLGTCRMIMSLLVITRLMWHRNDTNVSLSDDAITSNEDEVNHSASWDSVGVRHDVEGNNRSALSDQTDNLA